MLSDQSTGTEAFADAREPLAQAFKQVGTPTPTPSRSSSTTSSPRAPARRTPTVRATPTTDRVAPGQRAGGLRRRVQDRSAASPGSSWPVTSTPTPRRTRSRSSTPPATPTWSRPATPTRRPTTSTARSARSTTCSPTRRPLADVDAASTSGTSTATSRSTTSTAASTTTSPTSTHRNPVPLLRPQPGDRRDQHAAGADRDRDDPDPRHQRLPRPAPNDADCGRRPVRRCWRVRSSSCARENPNTVFAAAGDLIGASTFESFIQKDKPTIDALNEAGPRGLGRGQPRVRPGLRRPGQPGDGAVRRHDQPVRWCGLAVHRAPTSQARGRRPTPLDADRGSRTIGGVKVGFVGAVTEHLPELVSPAGIADIEVTDIVDAVNAAADDLKADGRRRRSSCSSTRVRRAPTAPRWTTTRRRTSARSSPASTTTSTRSSRGHTHLAYNCSFPVPGWARGRPVTERPVVSAGQYGMALNKLRVHRRHRHR